MKDELWTTRIIKEDRLTLRTEEKNKEKKKTASLRICTRLVLTFITRIVCEIEKKNIR